ncbi:hypothetical protein N1851_017051 [Merluccius polli]|uniref:Uncharacterized protein n=1 Tax=Merluccius polli TaxID=89951 RepID=A0AA47MQ98_MERPO|nr:hypothetical protein N1851_017051 [Merluccius polli]
MEPTETKRVSKPTAKAFEDKLKQLKGTRKAKFTNLTKKMKGLDALMEDDGNFKEVSVTIAAGFTYVYMEFRDPNDAVKNYLNEEEALHDQTQWYEPKAIDLKNFVEKVESWLEKVKHQDEEAKRVDAEIEPEDSASVTSSRKKQASRSVSVMSSTASSTRLKVEAERAALLARAESLKQLQQFEREEALLKARKQEFELRTAIAAANAKLEVLTVNGPPHNTSAEPEDGMAAYFNAAGHGSEGGFRAMQSDCGDSHVMSASDVAQRTRLPINSQRSSRLHQPNANVSYQPNTGQSRSSNIQDLLSVMQKQNKITELLVKQQKGSTLPRMDIPVFDGDPLEFGFFMKSFEHGIGDRTDSNRDRLHFLQQFTRGRPKILVRSCSHMHPDRVYVEAKKLLNKHFGNEYTIASAYIEKALKWPAIRSDDGEALRVCSVPHRLLQYS